MKVLRYFSTHFATVLQPRFLDMARGVWALTAVSDATRMRLYEALVTLSNGTVDAQKQVHVRMFDTFPPVQPQLRENVCCAFGVSVCTVLALAGIHDWPNARS